MTIEKDGGPAFGQVVDLRCVRVEMDGGTEWEPHVLADSGMRLRDYFAAKAPDYTEQWFNNYVGNHGFRNFAETRAAWNYEYADAMLEARKK